MTAITLGTITKLIKNNKQNVKINLVVDKEFEQTDTIKKKKRKNTPIKESNIKIDYDIDSDIDYKENEILNIPKKLDNLFDNLIYENYYLFGTNNNILTSLLYVLHKDFKFKSTNEKTKFIIQLKKNILEEFPDYFRKNKYSHKNFNKNTIIANIKNNIYTLSEIYYLSDYYNINLIVIEYTYFTYLKGIDFNENNNNIILIKYNDYYLPLIHIFGEYPTNLLYKCVVNKLKINSSITENNSTENNSTENNSTENNSTENNSTESIKLKALSSYKLKELQDLATINNITLIKDGKTKTKRQLYDNLDIIINGK